MSYYYKSMYGIKKELFYFYRAKLGLKRLKISIQPNPLGFTYFSQTLKKRVGTLGGLGRLPGQYAPLLLASK